MWWRLVINTNQGGKSIYKNGPKRIWYCLIYSDDRKHWYKSMTWKHSENNSISFGPIYSRTDMIKEIYDDYKERRPYYGTLTNIILEYYNE